MEGHTYNPHAPKPQLLRKVKTGSGHTWVLVTEHYYFWEALFLEGNEGVKKNEMRC